MNQREKDLRAMLAVAYARWEAACVGEDRVVASGPKDVANDDDLFEYARELVLARERRQARWCDYERIHSLLARLTAAN
jgi:hypothetical protein